MSIHRLKKKSGTRYRVMVRVFGKQLTKTFIRKIDAEQWEREQLVTNKVADRVNSNPTMTLKELATKWIETYSSVQKAHSSARRDQQILDHQILPAFGSKRISDLQPVDIESWIANLRFRQKLSPKTCNSCLGLLRKILSDGIRWRHLVDNPAARVKALKLPEQDFKFWTAEEVETFLTYTQERKISAYPVFVTALHTGMRLGELRALKWDCVDLERRQITVKRSHCRIAGRDQETTKSKRIRRVPINSALLKILVELKGLDDAYVLPRVDWEHLRRRLRDLAPKAGVKPIRFHDLRHTFASNFMMRGGTIYDLQRILGHSSIQMTERYSHLSPEHLNGKTEIIGYGSGVPAAEAEVISLDRRRSGDRNGE